MDRPRRLFIKSITWRVLATVITVVTSFVFLGSWETSLSIGIAVNLIKILFYYIHERVWAKIKWGFLK